MIAVGSTLYFSANDGSNGAELWKSNGTSSGTVMVMDINPNTLSSSNPGGFLLIGDMLCFSATDGASGVELWSVEVGPSGNIVAPGHVEVIFS